MDIVKYTGDSSSSDVKVLDEFKISNYTSRQGKEIYSKVVNLLSYMLHNYDQFLEDFSKLQNVIEQRKNEIPENDYDKIQYMMGEMAIRSMQIQNMLYKDKQQILLKRLEKEVQESVALQPKYLAESEREKRYQLEEQGKQWSKKEGLSVIVAAAGAGAVGYSAYKVTNFTQLINGALVGTSMWLKAPLGFCQNISEEVEKSGWFGNYTETVNIRPDNVFCKTLDTLSYGLTGLANSAEDLKIGTLVLITIIAFFFFMFVHKIMVAKYKVSALGFSIKKD